MTFFLVSRGRFRIFDFEVSRGRIAICGFMFLLFRAFPFGCCPEVGLDFCVLRMFVFPSSWTGIPKEEVAGVLTRGWGNTGEGGTALSKSFLKKMVSEKKESRCIEYLLYIIQLQASRAPEIHPLFVEL